MSIVNTYIASKIQKFIFFLANMSLFLKCHFALRARVCSGGPALMRQAKFQAAGKSLASKPAKRQVP